MAYCDIGVCPIDRVTGISKVSKKNKRPTKKLNLEFWEFLNLNMFVQESAVDLIFINKIV